MASKKLETRITQSDGYRYFTIYIFDQADADKLIKFLLMAPLTEYRNRPAEYSSEEDFYLKMVFSAYNDKYLLQATSPTRVFTVSVFDGSESIGSIIDYLFKIMTPQQKVQLAFWLEKIE